MIKKFLAYRPNLAIVAALIVGAGVLGHFLLPPKPNIQYEQVVDQTTKTQLDQTIQQRNAFQEQLTIAQNTIVDLKKNVKVVIHKVTVPNGTTTTDTTVTDNSTSTTTTNTNSSDTNTTSSGTDTHTVASSDTTTHVSTKLTQTTAQARWYLGATVGLGLDTLKLKGGGLITGPLDYGLEAKYRLVGPFWVGGSITTSIKAQLSLGLTF